MELLGAGGMGIVYRAFDTKLKRTVALKLHYQHGVSRRVQSRMLREAEGLARLSHPNVVTVYDAGLFDDGVYIAMELVEGMTLEQWLRSATRSADERLDVLIQAGRGLAAAHDAGLVHRDFKPENILIDAAGRARVIDFGLVKEDEETTGSGDAASEANDVVRTHADPPLAMQLGTDGADSHEATVTDDRVAKEAVCSSEERPGERDENASVFDERLTRVGARIGTLLYMSPEQRLGQSVGQASDQFSYCVTFFEAFAGGFPFPLLPEIEFFEAVHRGNVIKLKRTVPRSLRKTIYRGLAFDPAHRHRSLKALLDEITHRRRGRRLAVLSLAVTAAVAAAGLAMPIQERAFEKCAKSADGQAALWSKSDSKEIGERFRAVAGGHGSATAARIDARMRKFSLSYRDEHVAACRATHTEYVQSEVMLDARMACLRRVRSRTELLLHAWREAELEAVDAAHSAMGRLEGLVKCGENHEAVAAMHRRPESMSESDYEVVLKRLDQGIALQLVGRFVDAERVLATLYADVAKVAAPGLRANVGVSLGEVLGLLNRFARADRVLRDTVRDAEVAGLEHIALSAVTHRADSLAASGQESAARVLLETVRGRMQDKPQYAAQEFAAAVSAGWLYNEEERYSEAEYEYGIAQKLIHAVAPAAAVTLKSYLSELRSNQGRFDEAVELARDAYETSREAFGAEHPSTIVFLTYLAVALRGRGELEEARAHMQFVLKMDIARYGLRHRDIAIDFDTLSLLASDEGDYDAALDFARRAYDVRVTLHGEGSPSTLAQNLATAEAAAGQVTAARARFIKTIERLRRASAEPSELKPALADFALFEVRQENWSAAEPLALEAHRLAEAIHGDRHSEVVAVRRILAEVFLGRGAHDEALKWAEQALSAMPSKERLPAEQRAALDFNLARALYARDGTAAEERARELLTRATDLLSAPRFAAERRLRNEIYMFQARLPSAPTALDSMRAFETVAKTP